MPVYLYTKLGERIELKRKPQIRRFTEFPASDAPGFNQHIMKEYRKREEREGSRFSSNYSKNQIKAAWQS